MNKLYIVRCNLNELEQYSLKTDIFYARINGKILFDSICDLCAGLSTNKLEWCDHFLNHESEHILESFLELEDIKEKYVEYYV